MAAELVGAFRDEFVTSLAALALYDGDAEISADNINALLKASNNLGVKPYWPTLVAGLLKNGRIESIIYSGGVTGGGSGSADAASGKSSTYPSFLF
jgi:ribosomal protein L12E/L44/L45/RPP1/RPP2